MTNMQRLERIVAQLPEAERVDIVEWDDHPSFRVRGKNFAFSDADARHLTVKLTRDEAAAVVATDPGTASAGYGLGRHGWIDVSIPPGAGGERWRVIREWIRISYTLVAPKRLARLVLEQDRAANLDSREHARVESSGRRRR
jgi:predicted DNA-binding protein (MmcQ/YjbR family)